MPELLLAMFSSLLSPNEWEFFQYFVPFCAIFALFFICRVLLGDFGDIASIHPLLLCCCLSLPMWSTVVKKPARCTKLKKPKKEEIPVVLEPAKKKPLKEKRKRKKSADKDNKDPIKMGSYRNPVQTTIYSTLPLYEEVKNRHSLKDADFYAEFNRFVLTPEQLTGNQFPLECPENPGHIILGKKEYRPDPTAKSCARCKEPFRIIKDEYFSDTKCSYHTARYDVVGHYKCCGASEKESKGCTWGPCHVSSKLALDDLIFKRVEGKRQVREDQSHKVYALDCEMVYTTIGMEVTKVGLVDLEGKTIYQTFVLPEHPILDYNTQFSGITANDLKGVRITLADVQSFLLRTLNKDTILVGHALQNDLRVLRLIHERVVDTQVVFDEGKGKRKLKVLAHEHLNRIIQDSKAGHDSTEDARACMELMLWKIKSDLDRRPPLRKKQSFPASCLENGPVQNNKSHQTECLSLYTSTYYESDAELFAKGDFSHYLLPRKGKSLRERMFDNMFEKSGQHCMRCNCRINANQMDDGSIYVACACSYGQFVERSELKLFPASDFCPHCSPYTHLLLYFK